MAGLPNGGTSAKWPRGGKESFLLDLADNLVAVDVNTSGNAVRLGVPHALFQTVGIQREDGPFDVTADGKKFLLTSMGAGAPCPQGSFTV